MTHDLTHASFFSGVGGLDLGLERAGWRTVSFSEIDPYASAVLAERWPGVPNLGDITDLASAEHDGEAHQRQAAGREPDGSDTYGGATLWSGGFPCQDLSVAGKRAGFAGERSSLAFAFLDLVERHRPPAILLENVPGLLSSNGGRDFGTLLGRLEELGYGWAYRILDAQFFGVPQRRRRVFILAFHAESGLGADSAAEVLSVGTRCDGHSQAGDEAGEGASGESGERADIVGTIPAGLGHHGHAGTSSQAVAAGHVIHDIAPALMARDYKSVASDGTSPPLVVGDSQSVARGIHTSTGRRSGPAGDEIANLVHGPSPDPGGVREADGLAGRLDDSEVVAALRGLSDTAGRGQRGYHHPTIVNALDQRRGGADDNEAQAGQLVAGTHHDHRQDPLLPLGLDSHRYRCCGNGVVSNVSEWVGRRLAEAMA